MHHIEHAPYTNCSREKIHKAKYGPHRINTTFTKTEHAPQPKTTKPKTCTNVVQLHQRDDGVSKCLTANMH